MRITKIEKVSYHSLDWGLSLGSFESWTQCSSQTHLKVRPKKVISSLVSSLLSLRDSRRYCLKNSKLSTPRSASKAIRARNSFRWTSAGSIQTRSHSELAREKNRMEPKNLNFKNEAEKKFWFSNKIIINKFLINFPGVFFLFFSFKNITRTDSTRKNVSIQSKMAQNWDRIIDS